jgi:hypothetical protein
VNAAKSQAGARVGEVAMDPTDRRFIGGSLRSRIEGVVNVSLAQCPYDGTPLDAEVAGDGRLLVTCASCAAGWEAQGSHVRRVRDPDRERMIAARQTNMQRRQRQPVRAAHGAPVPEASPIDDDLAAIVVRHLAEAVAHTENANDVVVAQFIASRTNYGGRTKAPDRATYVYALADIIRTSRHSLSARDS